MTQDPQTLKRRLDRPFALLLQAQDRYAKAKITFERARDARDDAIRSAAGSGRTRRAIAQATGLTAGRVQQIIDRHR